MARLPRYVLPEHIQHLILQKGPKKIGRSD
jgi:hypothetical protein